MKILLLSCSTGEGHNHCALAVKEALQRLGHQAEFLDMLNMFGDPGPLSFDKVLNRISTKAPDIFGMMYHAGQMYSATGVTSPVYLANIRHAKQLCDFICEREYDAVLCSHLFPMETLTYLRRHGQYPTRCYGILSDYTCIPFLVETELDGYFLPHPDVKADCVRAGLPEERLFVTGMPVAEKFAAPMSREAARAMLGLPQELFTPLFAIGACLGAVAAPLFGLPAVFGAALCYAAVFGSASNTWLAPICIGTEVFGFSCLPYFAVVCTISRLCSGNRSMYGKQKPSPLFLQK